MITIMEVMMEKMAGHSSSGCGNLEGALCDGSVDVGQCAFHFRVIGKELLEISRLSDNHRFVFGFDAKQKERQEQVNVGK